MKLFKKIIWLIMASSVIAYTLISRPVFEFLKYSFIIDTIIFFIILSIAILVKIFSKYRFQKDTKTTLFLVSLIGPIYYSYGVAIKDLFVLLPTLKLSKDHLTLIAIFAILMIALLLFWIRLKYKLIYGLTEIIVGIHIAIDKVTTQISSYDFQSISYITILTASIYLVIRGYDNIYTGFTKEPYDPWAKKIKDHYDSK